MRVGAGGALGGVIVRRLPLALGVLLGVLPGRDQVGEPGGVDDTLRAVLREGLVDGRLEAAEVDGHVGLGQLGRLLHAELEVVRLLTRAGQVDHRDVVAADPLGQELQGVHRGHDRGRRVVRAGGGVGTAGGEGQQQERDDGDGEVSSEGHDNHSQLK